MLKFHMKEITSSWVQDGSGAGVGGGRLEVCQEAVAFHTLFWDYFFPVIAEFDLNM